MTINGKTLVIQGGTLIDGTGGKAAKNDCLVIEGNRIKSVGAKPKGLGLRNPNKVERIDATGQWVMPGLIDAHVHLSFGHPMYPGIGRGTISAEFTALRAALNAQAVLRAGVTSISVPGGAWFSDVAVREAINAGIIQGPRIYCAGRLLSVLGGGGDREPHWVGTPDHAISKLCHGAQEMVAEVRRQAKHHVDYIKLIDSDWGDFQAFPTTSSPRSPARRTAAISNARSTAAARLRPGPRPRPGSTGSSTATSRRTKTST